MRQERKFLGKKYFLLLFLLQTIAPVFVFVFFPPNTLTNTKQAAENQTLALLIMSRQKKKKTPLFFSSPFCSFWNCKREFQNVVLNFVCEFLNFTGFSEFTFHKVLQVVTWHCEWQSFTFVHQAQGFTMFFSKKKIFFFGKKQQ